MLSVGRSPRVFVELYDDAAWFECRDSNKLAGLVNGEAARMLNQDSVRLERLERNLRLYGGSKARNIRPWQNPATNVADILGGNVDKLRLNVIKAAIDTITSKVGKIRPRPTFLTDGGDFSTQLRAKNLQRFMDGTYHQSDVYEITSDTFRDAMCMGTGVIHNFTRGQRIVSERTPCYELFTDRADAMYGNPRLLYRIKWIAESQVSSLHPKAVAPKVDHSPMSEDIVHGGKAQGFVRVVEAWCRPTCPVEEIGDYDKRQDAKDYHRDRAMYNGRHVIVVGDEVVLEEDWSYPDFPFVFIHWSRPVQGFWGDSAIDEVAGLQVEVNKLLQFIQESMQKVAQPFVLRRKDAIATPGEITNLVAQVLDVDSAHQGPLSDVIQVVAFNPVSPQVYQHLWSLYAKAFEILGSNQLAASATAPAGLESGRALEQLAEEHSERFMSVSRHFEHCIGELLARQYIRCAKEIDERLREGGKAEGFVVRAPNGRAAIKLRWSDVAIDEDGYVIQVFPTSVLPTTPAARIQEVERMSGAGWISPTEARRMLDFPDLRSDTDLATADRDNLMRQLEMMLEHGEVMQPEPYQDLTDAIRVSQQAILRAQIDGAPEERIDLVRDFITSAEQLLKRTAAPNAAVPVPAGVFGAPAQGASPAAPAQPAAPGAPPTP